MSSPNTPILNPLLAATGKQPFNSAQGYMDWSLLQKFLGNNIPTVGIDAVASGADPSGQTDSTAALQQILTNFGMLFLRPGTYLLSSSLTASGNVFIWCEGQAVFQMANGGTDGIIVSNAVNVLIEGIQFAGVSGSLTAVLLLQSNVNNSRYVSIERCSMTGWNTGVSCQKIFTHYILDCTFQLNTVDINVVNCVNAVWSSLIFGSGPAAITGSPLNIWQSRNCVGLDDDSYAWAEPKAQAWNSLGQSLPGGGVFTALTFNTAVFNQRGVWTLGDPTKFTAPVAGVYLAACQLSLQGSGATVANIIAGVQVLINGSAPIPTPAATVIGNSVAGFPIAQLSAPVQLNAGDFVQFQAFQNTGGFENTFANFTYGALVLRSTP